MDGILGSVKIQPSVSLTIVWGLNGVTLKNDLYSLFTAA